MPNNLLNVDLQKTINTYTQKDDLELLNEMVEWVQAHDGYIPDINSNSREEARRAITLKRIQSKYEKYLQNPELYNDFDEEEQEEIEEIQNIIKKGSEIDLWEIEFPDRIGKDGKKVNESELENIEFYLEGTMRDLYELQEEIEEEEEKGTVERFIGKIETLINLVETDKPDVIEIKNSDTIGKLAEGLGISEEQIEEAGLDSKFKIGQQKANIVECYRDARDVVEGKKKKRTTHRTPPTPEQVDKLKELGISLEEINPTQEFIEKIETLINLVETDKPEVIEIKTSDTIGKLAEGLGISEEQVEEAGLDSTFKIGQQKANIAVVYRDARDVVEGKKKKRTTKRNTSNT